ncbi:hypothetical protein BDK51DRAFT_32258 [Blyttiomyces helicus]|uniref:Cyclin N-terminal domain-containing protein n=1 Tax=Blyttiomyces helicus TaxID=388810 RepID=A0A4P9W0I4_9FUNG|nr:hypothetical protein BDK51DRAFT_32258 [Blyttiomyces helicus]|eukprot:RKO85639.1 hypothetical protein BDK51DRAFT_32258 [Blyttiomyces helicus]
MLLARTQVSLSVVLLALKYIQRASVAGASAETLPLPILFLTALLLANKFTDDDRFSNSAWADAAGVEAAELNRAERVVLAALEFNLNVSEEEYAEWLAFVEKAVAVLCEPTPSAPAPFPAPSYGAFAGFGLPYATVPFVNTKY